MDDELKTSIISAIRTLDDDAYRAWFGTKPPRMFARLASQVGFGSRVLDLEELPSQFLTMSASTWDPTLTPTTSCKAFARH